MGWKGKEFYNSLMQKCLDDIDILLYSTYNEAQSVIAEEFIKTRKGKSYIKMTANDNKCYLGYLIKLVDKSSQKTPKFKADDRARITKHKNTFSKGYTENQSREKFLIYFALILGLINLKSYTGGKIKRSFYEKEMLLSKL